MRFQDGIDLREFAGQASTWLEGSFRGDEVLIGHQLAHSSRFGGVQCRIPVISLWHWRVMNATFPMMSDPPWARERMWWRCPSNHVTRCEHLREASARLHSHLPALR